MADTEIVSEMRKIRLAVAELVELQRTLIAVLAHSLLVVPPLTLARRRCERRLVQHVRQVIEQRQRPVFNGRLKPQRVHERGVIMGALPRRLCRCYCSLLGF